VILVVKQEMTTRERLELVQAKIAAACDDAGRSPDSITLVGVSKTHPPQAVIDAVNAGLLDLGENRPEEAAEKIPLVRAALPETAVRWHMIGHIQSRKARLVVPHFALVHSVDSVKLAAKLGRLAEGAGIVQNILLEVNVSGEEAKSGWDAVGWQHSQTTRESLWGDIQSILNISGLSVQGLMTMAPIVPDQEMTRPVFANLRFLRDALKESFSGASWDELSMGMSDDYPVAIGEGATIVRIGRAIFGSRAVR
jgi:pyridoxal phosphate enzyme (YggS family)